mmetsp:Transcript_77563/g.209683  ORF Transcript_77563/g.209683 Transcript_77563/m.209683 type:complete len:319 (+) Transcript_77563:341-1297(+)
MPIGLDGNHVGKYGVRSHCSFHRADDERRDRDLHMHPERCVLGAAAAALPHCWSGAGLPGHHARILECLHQPCLDDLRVYRLHEEAHRHRPLRGRAGLPGVHAGLRGEGHEPVHGPSPVRRWHGGHVRNLVRRLASQHPERDGGGEHARRRVPDAALVAAGDGRGRLHLLHRFLQLLGRHGDPARLRSVAFHHRRLPHGAHLGRGARPRVERLQRPPARRLRGACARHPHLQQASGGLLPGAPARGGGAGPGAIARLERRRGRGVRAGWQGPSTAARGLAPGRLPGPASVLVATAQAVATAARGLLRAAAFSGVPGGF